MEAPVHMTCGHCGREADYGFGDREPDEHPISCVHCGHNFALVGQLRAKSAQEAIAVGPSEARDDHVPIDTDGGDGHGV